MLPTYEEIQRRLAVYEKKYRMAIRASCEYRNDLLHQGRLADASFNFTQKFKMVTKNQAQVDS